jgi:hypothetical protein
MGVTASTPLMPSWQDWIKPLNNGRFCPGIKPLNNSELYYTLGLHDKPE